MRKTILALLATATFAFSAHAGPATWTWPTARTDNSPLPLSAIGGFQIYDASVPLPSSPGTLVTGCTTTLPPTTATGSCTATFTVGHNYVIVIDDNSTPPIVSAPSNVATATAILAPPKAVADFKVIAP